MLYSFDEDLDHNGSASAAETTQHGSERDTRFGCDVLFMLGGNDHVIEESINEYDEHIRNLQNEGIEPFILLQPSYEDYQDCLDWGYPVVVFGIHGAYISTSYTVRDNKEIVIRALKSYGGVLEDASERLQRDPVLIKISERNM